ncbi:hypothetical protein N9W44_07520 [Alphaproteobacteria bacterium]|nr:hypothetical protein [Alphaproteobacteria bacterium]
MFYGYVTYWFVFPMIVSAVVDFTAGRKIYQSDSQKTKKRWMLASVAVNLLILCFFKYTGWASEITSEFFAAHFGIQVPVVTVPLPPGISFYTFQTMSYTLDIYRGQFIPERSFVRYMAFVTFFPQLVAGPIERAKDLLPQLAKKIALPEPAVFNKAFALVFWGLFVKLVFADNFGGLVELLQTKYIDPNRTLPPGWGLFYGYSFAYQIYCDFLAYTLIARGVALLFNIKLQLNFLFPFVSSNASEFWQRWHISLSTWIRDYVYIPLGGSKYGSGRTLINVLATMFLSGLWHGAGPMYIVWGLYHGLLLIFYRFIPIHIILDRVLGLILGRIFATFIFFQLGAIGWIFFRAAPGDLSIIFSNILNFPVSELVDDWWNLWTPPKNPTQWMTHVFLLYALPIITLDILAAVKKKSDHTELFVNLPWPIKTTVLIVSFYVLALFGARQENAFIYFQF